MKTKTIFAFFVYYGFYVAFVGAGIVFLSYAYFPVMDWVLEFAKSQSWFIRLLIFFCFAVLTLPLVVIGSLPVFWLDSVKRNKIGWLGSLISKLENNKKNL